MVSLFSVFFFSFVASLDVGREIRFGIVLALLI